MSDEELEELILLAWELGMQLNNGQPPDKYEHHHAARILWRSQGMREPRYCDWRAMVRRFGYAH